MKDMSQTAGDSLTTSNPQISTTPLIPVIAQNELVSVFTAYKCVALQDFARDERKVRVDVVVIDELLSAQAGEAIYTIEQFTGDLQMVTGQSLMLEVLIYPDMGTESDEYRHPVIALDKVVDLILLD